MNVYHYKDNSGEWIPFGLTEDDGKKWNLFCQRLVLSGRKEMYPYFSDYLTFLNELEIERNSEQ